MDHAQQDHDATTPSASGDVQKPSLDTAMQSLLRPIRELLERIESHLRELREEPPTPPDRAAAAASPPAVATEEKPALATSEATWERIFLGDELCKDPRLGSDRRQLLGHIVEGVDGARVFAAQMMLLQAAAVAEVPDLMRHVGEAYYRWRPRTSHNDDPLEKALAAWLTRCAEAAGLRNSIQLVRVGERFDSSRHAANQNQGGVEIVAVHGWVVLRDGNKVYAKARVSPK